MEDRPHDPRLGDEGFHSGPEERRFMDENMAMSTGDVPSGEPPYGLIERQIAFKLLAAHAMVDAEFYRQLREDPAQAAAQLHILLLDEDLEYIKGIVEWPVLDEHADAVRKALHTEAVVRSLW
jgi:hypothetical protein